jgi:hypothetical protein
MMTATLLSIIGVGMGLVVQTGALFYWAGTVRQMLRDHERRITLLEDR